jgi:threonine-phosphate decarboxylase
MVDLAAHGGDVYRYGDGMVDFSANINPLGLPPGIKKAIYSNLDKILYYPDPAARNVGQKIAEYWGIAEDNILLGNGSAELIYLIFSCFRPKTTSIPIPTFSEYELAAKNVESKIRFLKLEEKEGFRFKENPSCDILFLCNPNNPTGNLLFKNLKVAERLVVVDECFMDFLPDQKDHTSIWKAAKSRNLIVLRSFTKFFAIPGLRIGYLIGHREMVEKLRRYQPPWSTNCLAQIAAGLILNETGYIEKTHRLIEKERDFLFEQLAKIDGLKPYPSVANFLLVKTKKGSLNLKESLIKRQILIRNCSNFRGLSDRYIRVAVRSHKENLQLLAGLAEVL